jgi:hypothetical protein
VKTLLEVAPEIRNQLTTAKPFHRSQSQADHLPRQYFLCRQFQHEKNSIFQAQYVHNYQNGFKGTAQWWVRPCHWCKLLHISRIGLAQHSTDTSHLQAATGIGKETSFSFAEAGAKGVALAELNEEGGTGGRG